MTAVNKVTGLYGTHKGLYHIYNPGNSFDVCCSWDIC